MKKHIQIMTLFFSVFINIKPMQDFGRMSFQGCSNQKECGDIGFHFSVYSSEGLCEKCEFKRYPERYIACPFCRKPMRRSLCSDLFIHEMCYREIKELLVEALKLNNKPSHIKALEVGVLNYLKETQYLGCNIKRFISDLKLKAKTFGFASSFFPGIYKGAVRLRDGYIHHVWSRFLDIAQEDKRFVITQSEAKEFIAFIFEKYKIWGPETGTEVLLQDISRVDNVFEEETEK